MYREGRSGSIPSSRVSDVQMLAFVLLEPSAGKLACSVPRGLGAGNRAWLPSFPETTLTVRSWAELCPSIAAPNSPKPEMAGAGKRMINA